MHSGNGSSKGFEYDGMDGGFGKQLLDEVLQDIRISACKMRQGACKHVVVVVVWTWC